MTKKEENIVINTVLLTTAGIIILGFLGFPITSLVKEIQTTTIPVK